MKKTCEDVATKATEEALRKLVKISSARSHARKADVRTEDIDLNKLLVKPVPVPGDESMQAESIMAAPDTVERPQAKPAVSSSHDTCIAAGQIKYLGMQLNTLMMQVSALEEKITKMENASAGQALPVEYKMAVQQTQSLGKQVEIISEGLRATPVYNLTNIFNCTSCGTTGYVASKVKCTKCGYEDWWGWWPKKNSANR